MRKQRPIIVGLVISWFFAFYVANALATVLNLIIKLSQALIERGYWSFKSELTIAIRDQLFWSANEAVLLLVFLIGLWNMRKWGLYGFTLFLGYYFWEAFQNESVNFWTVVELISFFGCWFSFNHRPVKKEEAPKTHLYEGPTARRDHEPKSAVEDLIY